MFDFNEDKNGVKSFDYNGKSVRCITPNDVYFSALDTCKVIGKEWQGRSKTLGDIPDEWVITGNSPVIRSDNSTRSKEITFISQEALFRLVLRSNNPVANDFVNWVCKIIKEIHTYGSFVADGHHLKPLDVFFKSPEKMSGDLGVLISSVTEIELLAQALPVAFVEIFTLTSPITTLQAIQLINISARNKSIAAAISALQVSEKAQTKALYDTCMVAADTALKMAGVNIDSFEAQKKKPFRQDDVFDIPSFENKAAQSNRKPH